MTDLPPTRWQLAGEARHGYGRHFADLCSRGVDVDGEARLADALLARESRVLDVGSGMGRVGEALRRRGHRVVATEPDRPLRAQSRATFPDLPVLSLEALELTAERLEIEIESGQSGYRRPEQSAEEPGSPRVEELRVDVRAIGQDVL